MKNTVFTLSLALLFISSLAIAQDKKDYHSSWHPDPAHKCAAMDIHKKKVSDNPTFKKRLQQFEESFKTAKKSNLRTTEFEVLTIPVVVHVIHEGASIGQGKNLSLEQIQSQINVLNQDFRRQNPDTVNTPSIFKPDAGDTRVQFCLASRDPSGLPTNGITRTQSTVSSFDVNSNPEAIKFNTSGGHDIWDRDSYLNIWVSELGGGVLGFAQFPGGDATTDGVVLDYRAFGTTGTAEAPYNGGRTAVHEVGHWFNLIHTWADGGCNVDDGLSDTPLCNGEYYASPSDGCGGPGEQCAGAGPRMIENFMDYSQDGCLNLFTKGQAERLQYTIQSLRPSLYGSDGCSDPASKPSTYFTVNKNSIFVGESVIFEELTAGETSRSWSFQGGTPSSSSLANPVVTYSSAGTYDVTLTASNANGDSTYTISGYIEVKDSPDCLLDTSQFRGQLTTYEGEYGFLAGHNTFLDQAKAEYFEKPAPYQIIERVAMIFGEANASDPNSTVNFVIWDELNGTPGSVLYSETLLIEDIKANVDKGDTTWVIPSSPVVITGDYFIGIELNYTNSAFDPDNAVNLMTNYDGEKLPGTGWEKTSGGQWLPYNDENSWFLQLSNAIFPFYVKETAQPEASFSAIQTNLSEGASVRFISDSKFADSFQWMFEGGTIADNTLENPIVTYNTAGSYDVTLIVTNANGSSTETKTDYIFVTDKPVPDFSVSFENPGINQDIQFTDMSSAAAEWTWLFPGGDPSSSNIQNPVVSYPAEGIYDVTLIVGNANGDSSLTRNGYIKVGSVSEVITRTDNFEGELFLYDLENDEGYIAGHNIFNDRAKAEFFDFQAPYEWIFEVEYYFGAVNVSDPTREIEAVIWDGSTGEPGNVLAKRTIRLSEINTDVVADLPTLVVFDPPVNVSDDFFVGIDLGDRDFDINNAVGLLTNEESISPRNTAWEKNFEDIWLPYSESWNLSLSHAIFPLMSTLPTGTAKQNYHSDAISIFPNPASDNLNVESTNNKELKNIQIIDVTGKVLKSLSVNDLSVSLNVSDLPQSIYVLLVETNSGILRYNILVSRK